MAENKTQRTKASVPAFLSSLKAPDDRKHAKALAEIFKKATGESPAMWGTAIVGYGATTYVGSGGRTVDWFPVGFSPRKAALTLYLMGGLKAHAPLLQQLGPHKIGGGCLYLHRFDEVDTAVLSRLIAKSYTSNQVRGNAKAKGAARSKRPTAPKSKARKR